MPAVGSFQYFTTENVYVQLFYELKFHNHILHSLQYIQVIISLNKTIFVELHKYYKNYC